AALALALSKIPNTRLTLITPPGEGLPQSFLAQAERLACEHDSELVQHHDMDMLPTRVDVVYTARWTTMGVPKADPDWLSRYEPYAVTVDVMERVSTDTTIFMHDLPAMRGQEVTDEVLDGPRSVAFRQAYHKLASAMAVLNWCVGCPRELRRKSVTWKSPPMTKTTTPTSTATMLAELRHRLLEISDLNHAGAVLSWDQATYMPPGGAAARSRQTAMLSRLAHEKSIDAALGRLLDALEPHG